MALTALGLGSALAVASIAPSAAEKIISVVGATGVCMVSYAIPVAIQLVGHRRRWRHPDDEAAAAATVAYYAWHRGSSGGMATAAGTASNGGGGGSDLAAALLGGTGAGPEGPAGPDDGPGEGGGNAPKGGGRGTAGGAGRRSGWWAEACETWEGVVEPLLVLVIGVGFSIAALWVAIATLVDSGSKR